MSKEILNSLIANYSKVNGLFEKFVEISPDKVWEGKIGKFAVWQQVFHAYATFDFFLSAKDAPPALKELYPPEVWMFKTTPNIPAEKTALMAYIKEADKLMEKFFSALDDRALANLHEGFSSRRNMPVTNAGVISSIIGHMYYHFGQCDAALREHGLNGLL
jgi:uncharacterized damage-inducible protein DinB